MQILRMPEHFSQKSNIRAGLMTSVAMVALSVLLLPTSYAAAQDTSVRSSRVITYNIPAQPLGSALTRFADTTGLKLLFPSQLVAGRLSQAVSGTMSPDTALSQLLSNTGLSYRYGSSDTVTITGIAGAGLEQGASDGSTVLQSIVVAGERPGAYDTEESSVGTKTDTPLRDVPQSIQVVTRSVLTDRKTNTLTQALENVSNVQQNNTSANRAESFILRGFSAKGYAIDGSVDNAAADRPALSIDLAGVERVEVLKGPASVLYGRGDPGGLINVVTRKPTDVLTAEATTQLGSYGFRRVESSVSGPLNADGTLTGRLTGAAQTDGGFRGDRPDSDRQYIGGVLGWNPDEDTSVSLTVDNTHQKQPFDRGLVVTPDNKVSLPIDTFLGEDWSMVDSRKTRIGVTAEHQATDWLKLRSVVRYDDALTNDTGIDFRDLLADGRTLQRRYTDRTEDASNLDLQFESIATFDTGFASHTLLTGVEYTRSTMNFLSARANIASIDIYDPVYGAVMPAAVVNSDYYKTVRQSAVYVQDQVDFSDQWKMLAGLRYDYFTQDATIYTGSGQPKLDDGALTGRIGVVYQPIEPVSLYASYSTGFMPQNGFGQGNSGLAPEKSWQIEAGAKIDFIPDRLSATMSVFQITKNNVAVGVAGEDYSVLTGEQRSRGFEIDVTGEITPGWQLIASLGYVDATITEDDVYEVGNRLVGVPRWNGSLWTTYEFQTEKLAGLKVGAGVTAVGKRTGDLDNSFYIDGYYRLDASVSYQLTENLELSVLGRNLTNKDYILSTNGRTENTPGAPLSVLAAIKASF